MNYRQQFLAELINLQQCVDKSQPASTQYFYYRQQLNDMKLHIIDHEAVCGYTCNCIRQYTTIIDT